MIVPACFGRNISIYWIFRKYIEAHLSLFKDGKNHLPLEGKIAVLTSGPTAEDLDPVRFITNRSTGRMGTAIAEQLAQQGAVVTLISGPSAVRPMNKQIKIEPVRSAEDMYNMAAKYFSEADIVVFAAAVADFTPTFIATQKIKKKKEDALVIQLKRTKDIAAELGQQKAKNQIMIGFALETNNALKNAQRKLESKNLDMIVLNSLEDEGAGFAHNTNKVTFVERNGVIERFTLKSKEDVAKDIVHKICTLVNKNT